MRNAIEEVRTQHPFDLTAIVLLPDHLNTIWELPQGDQDYSMRWRFIKSQFTKNWTAAGGTEAAVSQSRIQRRERKSDSAGSMSIPSQDEADLKDVWIIST
uniref:hypothetical protein n=1 Tax=Rubinisphaera italica TaxID=2527969 RepID=UPI001F5F5EF9|nr:hypothetical protein [Rubinisphaera italica]